MSVLTPAPEVPLSRIGKRDGAPRPVARQYLGWHQREVFQGPERPLVWS